MDPQQQQPPIVQQQLQSGAWAPIYGSAFMNHCMHPQLQQLADAQWKLEVSAKLAAVLEKLRERFATSQNVCLCQTWVGADGAETANPNPLEVTLWADPRLAIVLDPLFQELRNKSCQSPVFFRNSMPGKVWRSGAVQIVQNLRILPPTLHPRSQLSEAALERLAEALYIPIYDMGRPAKGQVCVLEVLLSTRATEAMLVADVISFIGSLLTALHLSLANPVQQPVRRSVLCGRRARAADSDDGEASGGEAAGGAGRDKQQQQEAPSQRQAQQHGPGQQPRHPDGTGPSGAAGSGPTRCQASAAGGPVVVVTEQQQQLPTCSPGVDMTDGSVVAYRAPGASEVAGCGHTAPALGAAGCPVAHGSAGVHQAAAVAGALCDGTPASMSCGTKAVVAAVVGAGHRAEAAAGRCSAGAQAVPACSEQPTLPASPSHDRVAGRAGTDALAADAAGPEGSGRPGGIGFAAIPRKVRKLLDGPMQRSKSVVSVAALSDGLEPEDDEDDEGNGDGDVPVAEGLALALHGAEESGNGAHGAP